MTGETREGKDNGFSIICRRTIVLRRVRYGQRGLTGREWPIMRDEEKENLVGQKMGG
jgi:hypothetical protein